MPSWYNISAETISTSQVIKMLPKHIPGFGHQHFCTHRFSTGTIWRPVFGHGTFWCHAAVALCHYDRMEWHHTIKSLASIIAHTEGYGNGKQWKHQQLSPHTVGSFVKSWSERKTDNTARSYQTSLNVATLITTGCVANRPTIQLCSADTTTSMSCTHAVPCA